MALRIAFASVSGSKAGNVFRSLFMNLSLSTGNEHYGYITVTTFRLQQCTGSGATLWDGAIRFHAAAGIGKGVP